jgi:restriction system protein
MLTNREPGDWRELQNMVAEILAECGLEVETEKVLPLARGQAEIDVFAIEQVKGRRHLILCECKHWRNAVPQAVIHGFRTVVADAGANVGYLVSSCGFQAGAFTAAELTNLELVTWPEFQQAFEPSWIENCMIPVVTEQLDALMGLTEGFAPRGFDKLNKADGDAYVELIYRHTALGLLAMRFSRYHQIMRRDIPELPLAAPPTGDLPPLPAEVFAVTGYRDLLATMLELGEAAIAEFRTVQQQHGLGPYCPE